MADVSNQFKKIMKQIDERFPNLEERLFVKEKLTDITIMYLDIIDRLSNIAEMRLNEIEKKQQEIENKMSHMHDTVEEMENDIYSEDAFDFEIVCPYCNHEFIADIDVEEKAEMECPECHNIIELDWGTDEQQADEDSKQEKSKQPKDVEEPQDDEDM